MKYAFTWALLGWSVLELLARLYEASHPEVKKPKEPAGFGTFLLIFIFWGLGVAAYWYVGAFAAVLP